VYGIRFTLTGRSEYKGESGEHEDAKIVSSGHKFAFAQIKGHLSMHISNCAAHESFSACVNSKRPLEHVH
jgi:hypothetical protein